MAAAIKSRGAPAVLRAVTKSGKPELPNPPTFVDPVVASALAVGATSLSINCSSAYGRILAGDILGINGANYTVTAPVVSRVNVSGNAGFDNVAFTPALANPILSGAAITPLWRADISTYAVINAYPTSISDTELIRLGDMRVTLPAVGPTANLDIRLAYKLIAVGDERTILNLTPNYVQGTIVSYSAQAR